MWPQATRDEVLEAQELADAGDPAYTWQLDPQLNDGLEGEWAEHVIEPGTQIAERFLRDELRAGTRSCSTRTTDSRTSVGTTGLSSASVISAALPGRQIRCTRSLATTRLFVGVPINVLPTIDDLRYETVSIDLTQPVRRGDDGIWVVNRWNMTTPFAQVDPRVIQAEAEAQLQEFLQARVDGEGAEGYVRVARPYGTNEQVPLLYATTTGARYERFEIEQVGVPQWPSGGLAFEVRLFAEDGATVVEQQIDAGEGGALALMQMQTTENGRPVPQPFVFMDGKFDRVGAAPVGFRLLVRSRPHGFGLRREQRGADRVRGRPTHGWHRV